MRGTRKIRRRTLTLGPVGRIAGSYARLHSRIIGVGIFVISRRNIATRSDQLELTFRDNARDKIEVILSFSPRHSASLFVSFFFVSLRDCDIRPFFHDDLDSIAPSSRSFRNNATVDEYHIEKYNIVELGTRAICFSAMLSNAI